MQPEDPWCGEGAREGLWLTADEELPAGLLAALGAAAQEATAGGAVARGDVGLAGNGSLDGDGGDAGAGGVPTAMLAGVNIGFVQEGVLDRQRPGPALAAFLPDPAGDVLAGPADDGPPVSGRGSLSGSAGGRPGPRVPAPERGAASLAGAACLTLVSDAALPGVIRAWRRLASWAAAGELFAVAELASRREAAARAAGWRDMETARSASGEIAAALTLTRAAADALADRAQALCGLPGTAAALAAGDIDMPRALVIVNGVCGQDPALARRVEAAVLPAAPAQTTGQLRAAVHRALLAADPAAAERRREEEERHARVEHGPEHGGVTAALAGRYLPITQATAAWQRVTVIAQALKAAGAAGGLDELRAKVYLALLLGQDPAALSATGQDGEDAADQGGTQDPAAPSAAGRTGQDEVARDAVDQDATARVPARGAAGCPGPDDGAEEDTARAGGTGRASSGADGGHGTRPGSMNTARRTRMADAGPAGGGTDAGSAADDVTAPAASASVAGGAPVLTGSVNLTVPLATLTGGSDAPGELSGFGPVTAHTARQIAASALDSPAVRWCVTVTGPSGQAVGHGCARRQRRRLGQDPAGQEFPGQPPGAARGNAGRKIPSRDDGGNRSGTEPGSGGEPTNRCSGTGGGRGAGWAFTVTVSALAAGACDHRQESTGYVPAPALRHLIEIRSPRCGFPGCRRPASTCEKDHTVPYAQGGRSCECNLAPLCTYHHKIKHSDGWQLTQPEPGILTWVTPSGWTYTTGPGAHPT
ncbi:MAG TPA: HNH endonuclease signature motif containing protein [Streptosporangiaceae bacterium]|nr:HNH endonuclease signature motif containing protein [Streptosporangiaceae bacterium]